MALSPYWISRKEGSQRKEVEKKGSQGNSHSRKVLDLSGERVEPESWLLRQAGKAGCFGASVLVMRTSYWP